MYRKLYRLLICICFALIAICPISYGQEIKEFKRTESETIEWSPTGEYIATGHVGGVAIWNGENGDLLKQYYVQTAVNPNQIPSVLDLAWDNSGKTLAIQLSYGDAPNYIQVINIETGEIIYESIPMGYTNYIDWSPQGNVIAFAFAEVIGANNLPEIRLFDITSGAVAQTIPFTHAGTPGDIEFSQSGNMLAYSITKNSSDDIVTWNLENNTLSSIMTDVGIILDLDWRFDSQQIFSVNDNEFLNIWNVDSGELVSSFKYQLATIDSHPSQNHVGAVKRSRGFFNVLIINTDSGIPVREFALGSNGHGVTWKPDGSMMSVFNATPIFFTEQGETLPVFPIITSIDIVELETK